MPEELNNFLNIVSETYSHFDEDRNLTDRSMEISTRELNEINRRLKEKVETEMKNKTELEKQKLATMNILEDVHKSQSELKKAYAALEKKGQELSALKSLSEELAGALEIEEAIKIANYYIVDVLEFSAVT